MKVQTALSSFCFGKIFFNIFIAYGGNKVIDLIYFFLNDIDSRDLVFLRQQYCHG